MTMKCPCIRREPALNHLMLNAATVLRAGIDEEDIKRRVWKTRQNINSQCLKNIPHITITKKKNNMKKEIEVKIELTPKEFNALTEGGNDFHFERTFGYFKEDFSNIKEGIFPRIKYMEGSNKEIILTVKRKTKDNANFFEREEMEVKIQGGENVETLREILKSLGFHKEIIFEKKRKNVFKDDIVISFDELPFGFFVEFEGEPEAIHKYLNEFNLSDRPRITRAYLGLWEDYRKAHNVVDENCVFK